MIRDLTFEDVKHLKGKLNYPSNINLLAEIVGVASQIFEEEENKSTINKKEKNPSSSSSSDFFETFESQIPRKTMALKIEENRKRKIHSFSDDFLERNLKKPMIKKDKKTCSLGLKLKVKFNGFVVIDQELPKTASALKPLKIQEQGKQNSANDTLKNNQEKERTSYGCEILAKNHLEKASTSSGLQIFGKNNQENGSTSSGSQILANLRQRQLMGPRPMPPNYFRDMILELAKGRQVSEPILVVQKYLYESDIKDGQNRFLIPKMQMNEFVYEHEKRSFPIDVLIIESHHKNIGTVTLTKWKKVLVLIHNWGQIVKRNRLVVGMIMQLWAVRIDDELVLALVDVTPDGIQEKNDREEV